MAAVSIVSGSLPPEICGVGDYTSCLHSELKGVFDTDLLHIPITQPWQPELFSVFKNRELVHIQYPTEGWGNSILPSLMPYVKKRTKLLLTLHEWSQMNRVRRASIAPLIAKADGFLFVSDLERRLFMATAPAAARAKPSWVIPIGVNLEVPEVSKQEVLAKRALLTRGDPETRVITHFGFIHAGKQPTKLLDLISDLRELGEKAQLVFIGDFQKDKLADKNAFEREIEQRGLSEKVTQMGFVQDEHEAALIMAAADVSVSLFDDGLSPRRGSFWYATQHGRPAITTRPQGDSLEEFGGARPFLKAPWVHFVEAGSSGEDLAVVVKSLPSYEVKALSRVPVPSWRDIATQHAAVYKEMLGRE